jgi:thiamine-phosphate pyrophosphorylase
VATESWSRGQLPVDSRLYLIVPARPDLASLLEAAIRGGVDLVQIREKELPDRELLDVLVHAREVTARLGVPLVVNDRIDLAVLVEADYVHVGQDDLPVAAVRSFGLPIGLSTHTPEQIRHAKADYIGVGPVYATPTKPAARTVGLELVRHAARNARQPWFALGGIDTTNAPEVIAAGAKRIAVIRAITEARDPERAARTLRTALR